MRSPGYHDPLGAKLACALVGLFAYPFFGFLVQRVLSNMLIVSLGLFAFGFLLPDFWLYNRIKERQRAILNMLPDVLDLDGVRRGGTRVRCGRGPRSRAGGSDAQPASPGADAHAPGSPGGTPARGGMRNLGERCGIQEVSSMVSAFVQSERLGTPLGKTLRVHAESARIQRRHRAEERASLAPSR